MKQTSTPIDNVERTASSSGHVGGRTYVGSVILRCLHTAPLRNRFIVSVSQTTLETA